MKKSILLISFCLIGVIQVNAKSCYCSVGNREYLWSVDDGIGCSKATGSATMITTVGTTATKEEVNVSVAIAAC